MKPREHIEVRANCGDAKGANASHLSSEFSTTKYSLIWEKINIPFCLGPRKIVKAGIK